MISIFRKQFVETPEAQRILKSLSPKKASSVKCSYLDGYEISDPPNVPPEKVKSFIQGGTFIIDGRHPDPEAKIALAKLIRLSDFAESNQATPENMVGKASPKYALSIVLS